MVSAPATSERKWGYDSLTKLLFKLCSLDDKNIKALLINSANLHQLNKIWKHFFDTQGEQNIVFWHSGRP